MNRCQKSKSDRLEKNHQYSLRFFIDGHKIDGVRRFELKQQTGDSTPVLTIDLNALDLSTDLAALHVKQEGIGEIEEIKFKGMNYPVKFQ